MDPLQQKGEREMTVMDNMLKIQFRKMKLSVCLSGQWDFPAFDSLVICRTPWF